MHVSYLLAEIVAHHCHKLWESHAMKDVVTNSNVGSGHLRRQCRDGACKQSIQIRKAERIE